MGAAAAAATVGDAAAVVTGKEAHMDVMDDMVVTTVSTVVMDILAPTVATMNKTSMAVPRQYSVPLVTTGVVTGRSGTGRSMAETLSGNAKNQIASLKDHTQLDVAVTTVVDDTTTTTRTWTRKKNNFSSLPAGHKEVLLFYTFTVLYIHC